MAREFKPSGRRGIVVGFAAGAILAAAGAAAGTPLDTANGFYAVYATFHPSNGIPDSAARAKYAPFLSPALDQLLRRAGAAEERFAKANKDAPPLVGGDLFSSMFEGATAHKVGSCRTEGRGAACSVALVYGDNNSAPVRWTDTLYLVETPQGWRVDDIGYGGNWPYANRGRLSQTLHLVVSSAGD